MQKNILRFALLTILLITGGLWHLSNYAQGVSEAEKLLRKTILTEEVDGDIQAAIEQYKKIVADNDDNQTIAAKALLRLGGCYEKLGREEARKTYQKLVDDYPDQQQEVAAARQRLAALEKPDTDGNRGRLMVRKVWAGPEASTWGSVSPNGRYITFTDNLDLAVHDLVTDKNTHLTSFGSPEARRLVEFSIFSPDGKQIAYDRFNGDGTWDLCVIGLDGSGLRVLVHRENKDYIYPVAWSPDGERILTAFFRQTHSGMTGEITFVSVKDGSIQLVKPTHKTALSNISEMSLSPDGRYIAYHAAAEEGSKQKDLFLLSSDGSRDFPLFQHPANDRAPAWTPDGKKILFVSDRGGTPGFWMIEVEDGKSQSNPVLVRADIGQFDSRIGFTHQGSYFYDIRTTRRDVYTADLDPATGKFQEEPKLLATRIVGSNSEPAWSPDGQHLAFYRQNGPDAYAPGALTVVIRSVQTGNERELSNSLIPYGCVRWFPDGQSLLVSALRAPKDFRVDYYRVDVQTGKATLILQREGGAGTFWPGLSPDGKTIFFTVFRYAGSEDCFLLSYQIEKKQEKELYRIGPERRVRQRLLVSPNGQQVAFVDHEPPYPPTSVVKIVPTQGGEARELLRNPRTAGWFINGSSSLQWSPDGRYLFIITWQGDSGKLLRIPVTGGQIQELGLIANRPLSLTISPDGNRIAYGALSQASEYEIWVMENFLSSKK